MAEARRVDAAAGIVFDRNSGYSFLILKKKGTWTGWQFVQGKVEEGEEPGEAALREVSEETGLKTLSIAKKLPYKADYWFHREGEKIHKFLHFFLVKADSSEEISLGGEHSDYEWVSYDEALGRIRYNRDVFEKVKKDLDGLEEGQSGGESEGNG